MNKGGNTYIMARCISKYYILSIYIVLSSVNITY